MTALYMSISIDCFRLMSTGAVIFGRRTGDLVGLMGCDHHDGVPIVAPVHQAPASWRRDFGVNLRPVRLFHRLSSVTRLALPSTSRLSSMRSWRLTCDE